MDWNQILAPIIGALALALATIIAAVATGITGRIKAYFDAKGQAELSTVVVNANTVFERTVNSAAGQINLDIAAGKLDVTDKDSLKAEAAKQAALVQSKIPEALAVLKPAEGAIAGAILGKLVPPGAMLVPANDAGAVVPAVSGAAA